MDSQNSKYLELAIDEARKSVGKGGFPAGAVIVKNGQVVAEAISTGYIHNDPSEHAETAAIREACRKLNTANLEGAVMYESIECCIMCFSVAYWSGISKIVYACKKTQQMVSKGYYEGKTDNETLNKENNRQVELVYASEFEQESLKVIEDWEKQGGFNQT